MGLWKETWAGIIIGLKTKAAPIRVSSTKLMSCPKMSGFRSSVYTTASPSASKRVADHLGPIDPISAL
jgi:hypothetical protein